MLGLLHRWRVMPTATLVWEIWENCERVWWVAPSGAAPLASIITRLDAAYARFAVANQGRQNEADGTTEDCHCQTGACKQQGDLAHANGAVPDDEAARSQLADQPGKCSQREIEIKVKHERTADCLVAGFRWHKKGAGTMIGSLLLGLYDDDRTLHHVGVAAAFTATVRKQLVVELTPLRADALEDPSMAGLGRGTGGSQREGQRLPGATSRWNRGKDLSWEPLRPERVCEVAYDHMQGTRFRHAAKFRRWRPDKRPQDCRYDQLEVTPAYELDRVFGARDPLVSRAPPAGQGS